MRMETMHLNMEFVHSQRVGDGSAKRVVRTQSQFAIINSAQHITSASVGDHHALCEQGNIRAGGHGRLAFGQGTPEWRCDVTNKGCSLEFGGSSSARHT